MTARSCCSWAAKGIPVGRQHRPPSELVADLTSWTERHFPGAERTHVWSAQDYLSHNSVPFVGKLPRGRGRIYLATGYGKWGMTNAVAAALRLTEELRVTHAVGDDLGSASEQAGECGPRRPGEPDHRRCGDAGLAERRSGACCRSPTRHPLRGKASCAAYAVCRLAFPPSTAGPAQSPRFAHTWAECFGSTISRSPGDCPLHGSRFAADGSVLEGPATKNLKHPRAGTRP